MFKYSVLGFLPALLFSVSANALSCLPNYSGSTGCNPTNTAGSCKTLGYDTADVTGCKHYILCPFDTNYKRCTEIEDDSDDDTCPIGEKNPTCDTSLVGNVKEVVGQTSSGENCYKCKCNTSNICKWSDSNKGTATLSNKCCNGNYNTCTSTCPEAVSIPTNAHATATCTGCNDTPVNTAWECNDGYQKNSDGTGCQSTSKCKLRLTYWRLERARMKDASGSPTGAYVPIQTGANPFVFHYNLELVEKGSNTDWTKMIHIKIDNVHVTNSKLESVCTISDEWYQDTPIMALSETIPHITHTLKAIPTGCPCQNTTICGWGNNYTTLDTPTVTITHNTPCELETVKIDGNYATK